MDCFQVSMGQAELELVREMVAQELERAQGAGAVDEERVRVLRELVVAFECADKMF